MQGLLYSRSRILHSFANQYLCMKQSTCRLRLIIQFLFYIAKYFFSWSIRGLLLLSGLSGVWFGVGGTPTHRHFPFLPNKKGCQPGGEGLPHIDFGVGYTTHTPHPILDTVLIHREGWYPLMLVLLIGEIKMNHGCVLKLAVMGLMAALAVLAVMLLMTLRWERPTWSHLSDGPKRPSQCSSACQH